jgi:hypothetical protein
MPFTRGEGDGMKTSPMGKFRRRNYEALLLRCGISQDACY